MEEAVQGKVTECRAHSLLKRAQLRRLGRLVPRVSINVNTRRKVNHPTLQEVMLGCGPRIGRSWQTNDDVENERRGRSCDDRINVGEKGLRILEENLEGQGERSATRRRTMDEAGEPRGLERAARMLQAH